MKKKNRIKNNVVKPKKKIRWEEKKNTSFSYCWDCDVYVYKYLYVESVCCCCCFLHISMSGSEIGGIYTNAVLLYLYVYIPRPKPKCERKNIWMKSKNRKHFINSNLIGAL